jgi:hypothetical protein
MATTLFSMGAHVQEGSGAEREIVLSKPSAAAWRVGLPARLDQPPATAALVEYVVKLYCRQMPVEAELTGCEALAALVRAALAQANGQPAEEWECGEVVDD